MIDNSQQLIDNTLLVLHKLNIMFKKQFKIIGIFFLPLFLLSGCKYPLYKADIQQGNIINTQQLSRLKLGMTKNEVKSLFGSPMLHSDKNDNWVYVYYYQPGYGHAHQKSKSLRLNFRDHKLNRVQLGMITKENDNWVYADFFKTGYATAHQKNDRLTLTDPEPSHFQAEP